ncbi:hypothetical protein PQX77_021580 [Marasmius sp. AFHP31]|nr:hypothetical protein PQX77_021580 [Marasmius sp. AFHP31]
MHWGFIEYNCAKHMYHGVLNKNDREQLCSKLDMEIVGNADDFLACQTKNEAARYGLQKIDYWTREYAEGRVDRYVCLSGGYSGEKLGQKACQGKNMRNAEPGPSSSSRGKGGKSTQQSPSKMLRGTQPSVDSNEAGPSNAKPRTRQRMQKPPKVESPASDALSSSNLTIRIPPSQSNVHTIAPLPLPPASRLFDDDDDPINVPIGVLDSDKPDQFPAPPRPGPASRGNRATSTDRICTRIARQNAAARSILAAIVAISFSSAFAQDNKFPEVPLNDKRFEYDQIPYKVDTDVQLMAGLRSLGWSLTAWRYPVVLCYKLPHCSMATPEPFSDQEGFGLPDKDLLPSTRPCPTDDTGATSDLTLVQQDVPMGPEASAGNNALPPTPLLAQHTLLTTRIQTLELEVERLSECNTSLEPLSKQNQRMLTESQTLQAENDRLTTLLQGNERQIAMAQQRHDQELEHMQSQNENLMTQER